MKQAGHPCNCSKQPSGSCLIYFDACATPNLTVADLTSPELKGDAQRMTGVYVLLSSNKACLHMNIIYTSIYRITINYCHDQM